MPTAACRNGWLAALFVGSGAKVGGSFEAAPPRRAPRPIRPLRATGLHESRLRMVVTGPDRQAGPALPSLSVISPQDQAVYAVNGVPAPVPGHDGALSIDGDRLP